LPTLRFAESFEQKSQAPDQVRGDGRAGRRSPTFRPKWP